MRYLISIDDTDDVTKEVSTGGIAEMIGDELTAGGGRITDGISRHQLLLNDSIAYTSHNSSMCMEIELDGMDSEQIMKICSEIILANMSAVSDPGLAVCCLDELKEPEKLISYGFEAKKRVISKEEAYGLAESTAGVMLRELGGSGIGVIGALAGIGLRLSGSDGSIRGKKCKKLDGEKLTAAELRKACGTDYIICIDGSDPDESLPILVDGFIKLMYFDGHLCCLIKPDETGIYRTVGRHQEREKIMELKGNPVCSHYEADNDEEEFAAINGRHSCFNCLYRRWTDGGYICMYTVKSSVCVENPDM